MLSNDLVMEEMSGRQDNGDASVLSTSGFSDGKGVSRAGHLLKMKKCNNIRDFDFVA